MKNIQRINVKIHTAVQPGTAFEPFLAILHSWKDGSEAAAEWLDIADYLHMKEGPGALLYGRKRFVGLDLSDLQPGLCYQQRSSLEGDFGTRLKTVLDSALAAAKRVAGDSRYPAGVAKSTTRIDIQINDRLQAPNTDATHAALAGQISEVLAGQFNAGGFELERFLEPDRLFGYRVTLKAPLSLKA